MSWPSTFTFEVECLDRLYLNVYQPRLQHAAGVAGFFWVHRGHLFASSALRCCSRS
jgi:hypothetical protein